MPEELNYATERSGDASLFPNVGFVCVGFGKLVRADFVGLLSLIFGSLGRMRPMPDPR